MRNLLLLCWLLVVGATGSGNLQAQVLAKHTVKPDAPVRIVTGIVNDENGKPLSGVSILLKNTTTGTATDANGKFSLTVPDEGGTLVISFIGYNANEVVIGNQTEITVNMIPDLKALDEVVVVGYGQVKKSDLTGSVSSIKAEEIAAYPVSGAVQGLQGRATGVQIQSTNGEPGAGFRVRVRGGSSINASSDPLYVVDGFIGGALPAPEDIASVEILKDASATAIYGARGANGVILVTSKSGKTGEFRINFSTSYSSQQVIGKLDLLNGTNYVAYQNEIDPNFTDVVETNTDWQDQIFQTGGIQNYQLGISGGSDKLKYYVSGAFFDQKGIILTSNFKRYNFLTNLNLKATERLNIGLSVLGNRSVQDGVRSQEGTGAGNGAGIVSGAYLFDPSLGIFKADGINYTVSGGVQDNPVAIARLRNQQNVTDRFQINTSADYTFFEGFKFKTTFGITTRTTRLGDFQASPLVPSGGIGRAFIENLKNTTLLSENYFQYTQTFNAKHAFDVLAGYSYQLFDDERYRVSGSGFLNDEVSYWNLGGAANVLPGPSSYSSLEKSEIASFYSRLNYGFDNRFLFTLTGRYDGSSVFSEGNKWAFFPSGAFAWNVVNESFMENIPVISDFKLRTSYGLTGNQSIRPYQTLASVTIQSSNGAVSAVPARTENKDLTWEITTQFNAGLDIAFVKGRFAFTADYYNKRTSDLLFQRPIPAVTGFTSQLQNIGELENKGFEFALNSKNLVGDFKWTTAFNISFNRNKVLTLPDNNADLIYSTNPGQIPTLANGQILRVGQPLGSVYGYVYEGVLQTGETALAGAETGAGAEKYKDISGDGILSDADRIIISNPNPDYIWGLNNDFSYKGFDLNVFFQASIGNDVLNYTLAEMETLNGSNFTSSTNAAYLNRWKPDNTATDIPRVNRSRSARISTRWIEDGSYVRLKNVALGYNLNPSFLSKIKIKSLRVYASAQNILTFTNYKGVDPEVSYNAGSTEGSNRNLGLDYGSYPNAKTYTIGLNIGL